MLFLHSFLSVDRLLWFDSIKLGQEVWSKGCLDNQAFD